ncbi:hypothetical protein SAMN05444398_110125 [Roseovarius pacificus]|uniref:Sulfotransferase family protein n=1 Tax=Roseovarius pacificus TaxID=337701 RepID=A0A1M7GE43_9RHOB|nr:hypothetical protein SAMN05444398_110125 [Roseovarius pacificus]
MATVWLHIGQGKTGTTSIQAYLQSLGDSGEILYPLQGQHNGNRAHHGFFPLSARDGIKWKQAQSQLAEMLAAYRGDARPLVLSSEHMCYLSAPQVADIAGGLSGRDVRIVYYVRPQPDLIESTYKTKVMQANVRVAPFHEWLERSWKAFDYRLRIAPWLKAFGQEAILVRPYLSGAMDVAVDFARLTGFSLPNEQRAIRMRPSLDARSILILHEYDRLFPGKLKRDGMIEALRKVEQTTGKSSFRFVDEELKLRILDYYRDSNIRFSKMFLQDSEAPDLLTG